MIVKLQSASKPRRKNIFAWNHAASYFQLGLYVREILNAYTFRATYLKEKKERERDADS